MKYKSGCNYMVMTILIIIFFIIFIGIIFFDEQKEHFFYENRDYDYAIYSKVTGYDNAQSVYKNVAGVQDDYNIFWSEDSNALKYINPNHTGNILRDPNYPIEVAMKRIPNLNLLNDVPYGNYPKYFDAMRLIDNLNDNRV